MHYPVKHEEVLNVQLGSTKNCFTTTQNNLLYMYCTCNWRQQEWLFTYPLTNNAKTCNDADMQTCSLITIQPSRHTCIHVAMHLVMQLFCHACCFAAMLPCMLFCSNVATQPYCIEFLWPWRLKLWNYEDIHTRLQLSSHAYMQLCSRADAYMTRRHAGRHGSQAIQLCRNIAKQGHWQLSSC